MGTRLPTANGSTLFIAEDNEELAKVIAIKMSRQGYTVESGSTGRETIAALEKRHPDLLLLDYCLPDMSAYDLVGQLQDKNTLVPFLVMTGEGDQRTAVSMMKQGALDYLVKDQYFLDNLEPAVERALQSVETKRRLQQAEEALRTSEERFQLAVAGSHDGIWEWRREGGQGFWWSPQVYELLGYEPDEVRLTLGFFKAHINPEHWHANKRLYRRHLSGDEPFELEFQMEKKDGVSGWFRVRGQTIRDASGNPKRMAGSFEDITQRKVSEEHRLILEAQLRQAQKLETIGTLAGGVAHDFNNILAAIYGYVALAERRIDKDHPAREDLDGIMQAAERAKDLVQQILTFSRSSSSDFHPLMIKPIFKESLRLMRSSIPSTIGFQTDIEVGDTQILGDPGEIEQVIINLCTNAHHAMQGKPGVIRHTLEEVVVSASEARQKPPLHPGSYVRYRIEDEGCGMDPNTLSRIWEPFFTTKNVGEGTGMGLSVVHGIVKKHSGAIFADSILDQGSRFEVYLPVHQPGRSDSSENSVPLRTPAEGTVVLLADDEEGVLLTTKLSLEDIGFQVVACHNPHEALEHLEKRPRGFHLLITDFTMPGMTGLELARRARELQPELPVLLTTGFSDAISAADLEKYNLPQPLMKPFTLKTLSIAASKALNSHHHANANDSSHR